MYKRYFEGGEEMMAEEMMAEEMMAEEMMADDMEAKMDEDEKPQEEEAQKKPLCPKGWLTAVAIWGGLLAFSVGPFLEWGFKSPVTNARQQLDKYLLMIYWIMIAYARIFSLYVEHKRR